MFQSEISDEDQLRSLVVKYDNGWVESDISMVMSCFSEEGVIIPHHGGQPIEGWNNIQEYWFPNNQFVGKVDTMESTIDEIRIYGQQGYVRGRFNLVFNNDGNTYRNEGNYLMVCEKDKEWKIKVRIWNDPIPATN